MATRKSSRSHAVEVGESAARNKDAIKEEFGKKVYHLMLDKMWNQSDLARMAGISRDDVSRYIRGVSLPTEEKLQGLCKAFGRKPEELLPPQITSRMAIDAASAASASVVSEAQFEMKVNPDNPSMAWVRVSRLVMMDTALKIAELLHNDNAPHGQASSR